MGNAHEVNLHDVASSLQFREVQEEDQELHELQTQALDSSESQVEMPVGTSYFEVRNHLLYWVQKGSTAEQEEVQLVDPTCFCQVIWRTTHSNPVGGHLGHDKTIARLTR